MPPLSCCNVASQCPAATPAVFRAYPITHLFRHEAVYLDAYAALLEAGTSTLEMVKVNQQVDSATDNLCFTTAAVETSDN